MSNENNPTEMSNKISTQSLDLVKSSWDVWVWFFRLI